MIGNKQMLLRSGDKVIASFCHIDGHVSTMLLTIKGFTAVGAHFKERSWLHFNSDKSWYAYGYHVDGYVLYVRYKWQIPRAYIFEKLRLGWYSEIKITKQPKQYENSKTKRRVT